MEILKVLLILVEVVCCFLLVGVILLQRSSKEGMGGLAMGGAMGEQLFGSRTGNVLTKTTIILACVFMGTTTLLAVIYAHGGKTSQSIIERAAAAQSKTSQPISAPKPAPSPIAPVAPTAPPATAPVAAPVESPAPATAPAATVPAATPAAAPVATPATK